MREASSQRGIERRPAGRPWQWPFAKAPGSLALPTAPVLPTVDGEPVTLAAGDVKTIVAIGALGTAGAQPFQFKVLDDR